MSTARTGTAGEAVPGAPTSRSVPELADGVQLLGTLDASGFKEPPCLARRADGQTIQLTDLLYRVLEAIDGRRDTDEIAAEVSRRIGKRATAEDVEFLVEEKLRCLGLLKGADGREPEVAKANPLLALRFRWVLADERATRRLTSPFAPLFRLPVVVTVILAFAAMVGWLLFGEGVGGGARQALYQPAFLMLVFGLAAASAGFHEFGHAAALRYGGGTPGAMGAGLYLVWPAFYTDVTDSYRLSRRARLRTDLGGLYFNMVFALVVFGAWAATGFDALLLVVPLLLLQMVQQLLPFVRLDGYHILADLTGVPDLFARIRPTLASLRPGRQADRRVTELKPWVRVVVTAWVVAVVPLLLVSLAFAVVSLPRFSATAWDSLGLQRQALAASWGEGDALAAVTSLLSIVALALPALGVVYQLGRIGNRGSRAAWRATSGRPVVRGVLGTAAAALVAVSAFVLWPNGEYRPYQPGERARLSETVAAVRHVRTGRPSLLPDRAAQLDGAPFRSAVAAEETDGPVDPSPTTTTTTEAPASTSDEPTTSTTTDATSTASTTSTTGPSTTTTSSEPTTTTTVSTTTTTETTLP